MKGLRPDRYSVVIFSPKYFERIDLIYEGIATFVFNFDTHNFSFGGKNWPDLWRDCDSGDGIIYFSFSERIDLIYEGIATGDIHMRLSDIQVIGKNWPDLWRDCDTAMIDQIF